MRTFKCAVVAVVVGACPPLARADVDWGLNHEFNDTVVIGLGALYAAKTSNTAQLNSTKLGIGTVVDFQNMLGMRSWAWGPEAAVRWRMSERWRIEASYFWISQSGEKSIDQQIQ